MAFQYSDDENGPTGFAYDAGDYSGSGPVDPPEPPPVITTTSRNLTLPEMLRGVS